MGELVGDGVVTCDCV